MKNRISHSDLQHFAAYLRREERSAGTIEKYLRDTAALAEEADGTAGHEAFCQVGFMFMDALSLPV